MKITLTDGAILENVVIQLEKGDTIDLVGKDISMKKCSTFTGEDLNFILNRIKNAESGSRFV